MQRIKSVRFDKISKPGVITLADGSKAVHYLEDRFSDTVVIVRNSVRFTGPKGEAVVVNPLEPSTYGNLGKISEWKQG